MAEPKTKKNDASVEAFLAGVPDIRKREDSFTVLQLMERVTGEKAAMWGDSIVGFGAYTMTYANGSTADWPILGFSPRKQNLTLYISSGFASYDALLEKLGKHSTSKACLYIKRMSDVDPVVLEEMLRASVAHMRTNPGAPYQ